MEKIFYIAGSIIYITYVTLACHGCCICKLRNAAEISACLRLGSNRTGTEYMGNAD